MNKYIKLSLLLCNIIIAPVLAQEIAVPSLRSLALDKSAELLHERLVKPQSPTKRQIILNNWQKKAGILFKEPTGSSDLYNQTILERFEQKYAQLKKITKFNGIIEAISHDGTKCCFRTGRTSLYIADLTCGKILHKFVGHIDYIHRVALTSDDAKAISASDDKTLKVWNINTGACLHTLQGHTRSVYDVALTSDNTKAISASADGTLKVWDINTGACLHTLQGPIGRVMHVTITNDNNKAVSASEFGTLKVWDVNTGKCLHTLEDHAKWISKIALTTDNTKAVSVSYDGPLKVWDINTGKCLRTLESNYEERFGDFTLTGDNTKAISASTDGTLRVWDINTGKRLLRLKSYGERFADRVVITCDNTKAISASYDGPLKVWDINTGKCLQTIGSFTINTLLIRKNLVAVYDSMYRFEDYQSVIDAMPQPKPGSKINNPARLIDLTQTGAATGLAKLQALKHKNIAMGLSPRRFKDKLITAAHTFKNKIVNAYKRLA